MRTSLVVLSLFLLTGVASFPTPSWAMDLDDQGRGPSHVSIKAISDLEPYLKEEDKLLAVKVLESIPASDLETFVGYITCLWEISRELCDNPARIDELRTFASIPRPYWEDLTNSVRDGYQTSRSTAYCHNRLECYLIYRQEFQKHAMAYLKR